MGVARRLPSPPSETALQLQMYVLEHYHAIDKHVEILSLIIFLELFNTKSWQYRLATLLLFGTRT